MNYARLHETRKNKQNKQKKKQANIKYDDYSGLTVEMQFLKAFK